MSYLNNIYTCTVLADEGYRYVTDLADTVKLLIGSVEDMPTGIRTNAMQDYNLEVWLNGSHVFFHDADNERRDDDHVLCLNMVHRSRMSFQVLKAVRQFSRSWPCSSLRSEPDTPTKSES